MLLILLAGGIAFGLSALMKQLFINAVKSKTPRLGNEPYDGTMPSSGSEPIYIPSVFIAVCMSAISVLLATLIMYEGAVWYYGEDIYLQNPGVLGFVGILIYRWLRGSTGFWENK
jgi:hypothetical protein